MYESLWCVLSLHAKDSVNKVAAALRHHFRKYFADTGAARPIVLVDQPQEEREENNFYVGFEALSWHALDNDSQRVQQLGATLSIEVRQILEEVIQVGLQPLLPHGIVADKLKEDGGGGLARGLLNMRHHELLHGHH